MDIEYPRLVPINADGISGSFSLIDAEGGKSPHLDGVHTFLEFEAVFGPWGIGRFVRWNQARVDGYAVSVSEAVDNGNLTF